MADSMGSSFVDLGPVTKEFYDSLANIAKVKSEEIILWDDCKYISSLTS